MLHNVAAFLGPYWVRSCGAAIVEGVGCDDVPVFEDRTRDAEFHALVALQAARCGHIAISMDRS